MKKPDILVIEDDLDIQQLVSFNLIKKGYNVSCADNGEEGLRMLENESFAAVILDLMLPGKDGMEICTIIRSNPATASLPVLMLTARSEEDDIVEGLAHGADDFVTKPFSPRVLVARIDALLRRKQPQPSSPNDEEIITLHNLQIMPARHEVLWNGVPVLLTNTEFTILQLLSRRPGWVFSRQQIIDEVRGYDYSITPRAVDVQIFGLRKKLGNDADLIETVRGIGYRIREE